MLMIYQHSLWPHLTSSSAFIRSGTTGMILPGSTNSLPVLVSIEPNMSRSTIGFSSVYRLKLLPVFNCFGHYICEIPLSVPTRSGFYTSNISLECSYASGDAEVILGTNWISACSITFCDDGSGLEDPAMSVISCLPTGHYWSPSGGMNLVY